MKAAGEKPARMRKLPFWLLLGSLVLSGPARAAEPKPSLAEAEKTLQLRTGLPPQGWSESDPTALKSAEAVFKAASGSPATASRARRDLLALWQLEGRFDDILRLQPADPRARIGRAVSAHGFRALRVEPFVTAAGDRWAVLGARYDRQVGPWANYKSPALLLTDAAGQVRWRKELRQSGLDDLNEVQLFVSDLAGLGSPQLIAETTMYGASWEPSALWIYGAAHQSMLSAFSDFPLSIGHVGGSKEWYVGSHHAIGLTLAHVDQPVWPDYFGFDRKAGRFVNANARLPAEFFKIGNQLAELVKSHPDDWDLVDYLGRTQRYANRSREARATYQAALQRIRQQRAQSDSKELRQAEARLVNRLR